MTTQYRVLSTRPTTYLSKAGRVVQGYSVLFELVTYDEEHEINVPDIKADTVKKVLDDFVSARDALANL